MFPDFCGYPERYIMIIIIRDLNDLNILRQYAEAWVEHPLPPLQHLS